MASNAGWRIPFGLFYIVPIFVASLIWFVPEVSGRKETRMVVRSHANSFFQSPRWLIMKDRPEEALHSLRRLRQGKFSDLEIEAELKMIHAGINQEHEKGTFKDMFRGVNLKRTLIVCAANFFLQATGSTFASVYGALFVKSLGTINPFTVTVIQAVISLFICLVAMVCVDRFGRR